MCFKCKGTGRCMQPTAAVKAENLARATARERADADGYVATLRALYAADVLDAAAVCDALECLASCDWRLVPDAGKSARAIAAHFATKYPAHARAFKLAGG